MAKALHTDQYCLTMGQYFFRKKMNDRVAFEQFVRSLPKHRGYLVAAGLGTALWWLRQLTFEKEDVAHLRSMQGEDGHSLFDDAYLRFLRDMEFSCDVYAIPEGTIVGPHIPLVQVIGPRIEATIIESFLLSILNHQTMIASKMARIGHAAGDRSVIDMSLRRLHGPEAALAVARASYIAGAAGTSTVEAGRVLGIPTFGTMAHHMVMAYGPDDEQHCFEEVMRMYPNTHLLLVDTYDTGRGVLRAVAASKATGIPLNGIRLDSDLEATVPMADQVISGARLEADNSRYAHTKIAVSNDLDEYKMSEMRDLAIDIFGVGTMLGTSADAPSLGGVYKLVEQFEREPHFVMKLTPGKQTDPGLHQVWRHYDLDEAVWDVLALADEGSGFKVPGAPTLDCEPLLVKVMDKGRIIRPQPTLDECRLHFLEQKAQMPSGLFDLSAPSEWLLMRSKGLWALRGRLGDTEAAEFTAEFTAMERGDGV